MEFCHKTSSYFFGYHYVARDIGRGLWDIPAGLGNIVSNPGSVISGACNLFTRDAWTKIATSAWNRPLRFTASISPSLVTFGYASFHAFTPTVHTVNTIHKAHLIHQIGAPLPALHASVASSQSAVVVASSEEAVNTIAITAQNRELSDTKQSSNVVNIQVEGDKVEIRNKAARGWDNLWVLLLPDLDNTKTALDFYEMISTLSQELEQGSESCEPISWTKTSDNRFFPSSRTLSSGPDVSSALLSVMHHSK